MIAQCAYVVVSYAAMALNRKPLTPCAFFFTSVGSSEIPMYFIVVVPGHFN